MDELELVKKARKGDDEAFKQLVLLHKKRIFGIVEAILGNPEDTDDVVQEVFCKVYHGIKKFRGESKFSTWVFRIAKNASIDFLRKKERDLGNYSAYQEAKQHIDKNTFLEKLELTENEETVTKVIDKLDQESKEILIYAYFSGLKQKEVAEMLDIPLGTVYSRVCAKRDLC